MKKAIKKLIFSTCIILVSLYSITVEILPVNLYISIVSMLVQIILIYATIVWISSVAEITLTLIYKCKNYKKLK